MVWLDGARPPTKRTSKILKSNYDFGGVWWNMSSREWMLRHQWNWRIWDPPNLIDSLFVLLICITKNTQVSIFTKGHFSPTPFPFSVQCFFSHSVNLLLSFSLSLPLHVLPTLLHLLISHKKLWQFIRWYHWINLIEWTWLFDFGIAHNRSHNLKVNFTTLAMEKL